MSAQVDGSLCSVKVGTDRVFPKDRNYAIQSIFSFRGKARAAIAIQGVESEPVEQRTKSNPTRKKGFKGFFFSYLKGNRF